MTLIPEISAGEKVLCQEFLEVRTDKGEPFCLTVTDRAVYLPIKRWFAVNDPWSLSSIPLHQVRRITVGPTPTNIRSLVIVVASFIAFLLLMFRLLEWHVGLLITLVAFVSFVTKASILFPPANRRLLQLVVSTHHHALRWQVPVEPTNLQFRSVVASLDRFVQACRRAGIRDLLVTPVLSHKGTA